MSSKYTVEQRIAHHKATLSKYLKNGDAYALRNYFYGALAKQRDMNNYLLSDVCEDLEVSCRVLAEFGGCIGACERCRLMTAHLDALEDIKCGIRWEPAYLRKEREANA